MAKFYGTIGYAESVESFPGSGVWIDQIVERESYGDIVRNTRQSQEADKLHNNLSLSNQISVVADAYLQANYFAIRYVRWAGACWTVPSVTDERPRLLLNIGEVYNGPTAD